jgi:hypothetical protein
MARDDTARPTFAELAGQLAVPQWPAFAAAPAVDPIYIAAPN